MGHERGVTPMAPPWTSGCPEGSATRLQRPKALQCAARTVGSDGRGKQRGWKTAPGPLHSCYAQNAAGRRHRGHPWQAPRAARTLSVCSSTASVVAASARSAWMHTPNDCTATCAPRAAGRDPGGRGLQRGRLCRAQRRVRHARVGSMPSCSAACPARWRCNLQPCRW